MLKPFVRRFSLSLARQSKAEWKRRKVIHSSVATIPELLYFIFFTYRIASWWTGGGCVCGEVQVGMGA